MAAAGRRAASVSLLWQRPAQSAHRPGRAWPRGPSGRLPAVVRVRNGRPDLLAGCLRAACRRSAACCWSSVSLPAAGPICSRAVAATRAATSLQCLNGVRGCSGVLGLLCVALGWCRNVVHTCRFEWSTGFGFLTVSAPPPAAFRCQLISQRQSRDHVGPGRTLVCLQRAPGARAVPSQSRLLGLIVHC